MPSSKGQDYDVEKIISKRTDRKGQIFYLIKWKGYSASDNTWEPKSNLSNCQELVKEFEAQEAEKTTSKNSGSKENDGHASVRMTRSSQLLPKESTNEQPRSTRSSNKTPSKDTCAKRKSSANNSLNEDEGKSHNAPTTRKSTEIKRLRKSTSDAEVVYFVDDEDSDVLDIDKLDQILNARRNKKNNKVEYYIQGKKTKKPVWVDSDRLTEYYNQQVVEFLEDKYV